MIKITKEKIKDLNEMIKKKHERHILKWNSKNPHNYVCPACLVSKALYIIFDNAKHETCTFCPLDWKEVEEFRIYNYMCERESTLYSQYLKNKDPTIALKIAERQFMSIEEILKKAKIEFIIVGD